MEKRKEYEIAAENFAALAKSLGLDVEAVFVPFSQSRSAGEKMPGLNWRCTVTRNGKPVKGLESVDYSQGSAYAPAYNSNNPAYGVKQFGGGMSIARDAALRLECETGKVSGCSDGSKAYSTARRIPAPKADCVLESLARDSDVLDYPEFEQWAGDLGFDPDSRKGELIYRQCIAHALALRAAIGDDNLAKLRTFTEEM